MKYASILLRGIIWALTADITSTHPMVAIVSAGGVGSSFLCNFIQNLVYPRYTNSCTDVDKLKHTIPTQLQRILIPLPYTLSHAVIVTSTPNMALLSLCRRNYLLAQARKLNTSIVHQRPITLSERHALTHCHNKNGMVQLGHTFCFDPLNITGFYNIWKMDAQTGYSKTLGVPVMFINLSDKIPIQQLRSFLQIPPNVRTDKRMHGLHTRHNYSLIDIAISNLLTSNNRCDPLTLKF